MRIRLIKRGGDKFDVISKANRRGEKGLAVASDVAQKDLAKTLTQHIEQIRPSGGQQPAAQ